MKKLLAIILAIGICLSFVACGKDNNSKDDDTSPTSTIDTSSLEINSNDNSSEESSSIPTTTSKNSSTVKPTSSTPKVENNEIRVGTTYSNKWVNSSIGLQFNLPSGWRFYSRDEMDDLVQMVSGIMNNTSLDDAFATNTVVYDMVATDDAGRSVNVVFEKLANTSMTEDQYIQASMSQLKPTFEAMGYSTVEVNNSTCKIGGKTLKCIQIKAIASGVELYETLICRKVGGKYMSLITLAAIRQEALNGLLNCFVAA